MNYLVKAIGSGLGAGYSPLAPGTVGSAVGLLIWVLLPPMTAAQQPAFVLVTFLIGVPICTRMEEWYGHDPHQATFDEFVGQWAALMFLPKSLPGAWLWLLASFLIFRAFDVWKPFPAYRSQSLPGGWGVMTDDLIVGVYTCVVLNGVRLLL